MRVIYFIASADDIQKDKLRFLLIKINILVNNID